MKKNWKEILKLWLGALLLFFAESAVAGCRKLRTLPKRALALCLAWAMIVAILPVNILLANAEEPSSVLPGARVETNDYGDVFLGGNYIEVGITSTAVLVHLPVLKREVGISRAISPELDCCLMKTVGMWENPQRLETFSYLAPRRNVGFWRIRRMVKLMSITSQTEMMVLWVLG